MFSPCLPCSGSLLVRPSLLLPVDLCFWLHFSLCVSKSVFSFLLFSVTLPISVYVWSVLFLCVHDLWSFCISLCLGLSPDCWAQALRLRVHPLYLMIPGTVGCSYAFMLPVSTPPNSIAFASGHLLVKDMVSLRIF